MNDSIKPSPYPRGMTREQWVEQVDDDTGLCRTCRDQAEYDAVAGPFDYED